MTIFIMVVAAWVGGEFASSQARQIGHAVHGDMQALQQTLTVQAHVHLFSVDHHIVKERIDWGAQGCQSLQRTGVIAGFEQSFRLGQQLLHEQSNLRHLLLWLLLFASPKKDPDEWSVKP
jgi:hypothetical protein